MSKLVIEGISAGYGSVRVLHHVSIEVNSGETVVLLGTNGNGKSTLLNSIMGIISPEVGAISLEIDGQNVGVLPAKLLVEAGSHNLVLTGNGQIAQFRLGASDGDAWCFADRGKAIKSVGCKR